MSKKILILFLIAIISGIFLTGCSKTTTVTVNTNLRVIVFGDAHQPLQGAKVVSNSQPNGQLKLTGLTDSDGIVWFQNIKPGDYGFYINRFDYNQTQILLTVNSGQTTEIPVFLVLTNPTTTTITTPISVTFAQLTAAPEQ